MGYTHALNGAGAISGNTHTDRCPHSRNFGAARGDSTSSCGDSGCGTVSPATVSTLKFVETH